MGKFFNENLMHKNFPFKRVSLGPDYAEERRGNLKVRKHTEPSGDIPPVGRDEGEAEQDNTDQGREHGDGEVGTGLHSPSSRTKTRLGRQANRGTRRGN